MITEQKLVLVSADAHVSPPVSVYRPYCERKYLDHFEKFIVDIHNTIQMMGLTLGAELTERQQSYMSRMESGYGSDELNSDASRRIASLDEDGIAAEFVYHGGFNRQPIPFFSRDLISMFSLDMPPEGLARELRGAGIRMYNRWLADWVTIAPERLIGIAHVPFWDIEASVEEVRFIHAAGLRMINLPAPRRGQLGYNHPEWDPMWALCTELGITLHTHGGGGDVFPNEGPGALALATYEMPFSARRGIAQLIYGGAFARFPELTIMVTEQCGLWVQDMLQTLDSIYDTPIARREVPFIQDVLPLRPSEYFHRNVLIGGSFLARMEAEAAVDSGYWPLLTWGRDFPHPEGTWPYTRESIRNTFAGLQPDVIRAVLGQTAVQRCHLDASALRTIADRVGPLMSDVNRPLSNGRPDGSDLSLGFRTVGAFA